MKYWILGLVMLMAVPSWALEGSSVSIFGFNYNVTIKADITDSNGNSTGDSMWMLQGTGGGMDFLVVRGPNYP
jgi:hypothetical protein